MEELRFDRILDFVKKKKEKKKRKPSRISKKVPDKKLKKQVEKKRVEEKKIEEVPEKLEKVEKPAREEVKRVEFITFRINGDRYGIPVARAREILPDVEIFNPPDLPSYFYGMARFRKEVVPILNLPVFMGFDKTPEKKNFILVQIEKKSLFFLVGEITGIVKERRGNSFPPPFNLDPNLFQKILVQKETLIGCLNVDGIVKMTPTPLKRKG